MPPKKSKSTISTAKPKPPPPKKPSITAPQKVSKPKPKLAPRQPPSEIPNVPLFKKGTEEREASDLQRNKTISEHIYQRLLSFMRAIEKNSLQNSSIKKLPQFEYCTIVMESPSPIDTLSNNPTMRGLISRFIDINAPPGMSQKTHASDTDAATVIGHTHAQILHDNIQHHIDQCRYHLETGDTHNAGYCIQLLDDFSQQLLPGKPQQDAFSIIDGLKDSLALLASSEPALHDKKTLMLSHDTGHDSESDLESVLSRGASDDDISISEDMFEPEL